MNQLDRAKCAAKALDGDCRLSDKESTSRSIKVTPSPFILSFKPLRKNKNMKVVFVFLDFLSVVTSDGTLAFTGGERENEDGV